MPGKSSQRGRQVLDWIKDRGVLVVTLTGVILYFFLSVPAAIFYAQFGVSAGEVGISYASLLSGSTVEIFLMVLILTGALFLAAYLLSVAVGFFFVFFVYFPYMLFHTKFLIFRNIDKLNDQQFDRLLRANLRILHRFQRLLQDFGFQKGDPDKDIWMIATERRLRHTRDLLKQRKELWIKLDELQKQDAPTITTAAQLELINSQISIRKYERGREVLSENYLIVKTTMQHWGWVLVISFISVTVVILLPVLAFIQANEVRNGNPYFGNEAGVFDYHADLVKVTPISNQPAPSINALRGEELFLLGENSQYAVLYAPSHHSTIRVPINSVVISTDGNRVSGGGI